MKLAKGGQPNHLSKGHQSTSVKLNDLIEELAAEEYQSSRPESLTTTPDPENTSDEGSEKFPPNPLSRPPNRKTGGENTESDIKQMFGRQHTTRHHTTVEKEVVEFEMHNSSSQMASDRDGLEVIAECNTKLTPLESRDESEGQKFKMFKFAPDA